MLLLYQLNCDKLISLLVKAPEVETDDVSLAPSNYILLGGCLLPAPYTSYWQLSEAYTVATWEKTHWTFGKVMQSDPRLGENISPDLSKYGG